MLIIWRIGIDIGFGRGFFCRGIFRGCIILRNWRRIEGGGIYEIWRKGFLSNKRKRILKSKRWRIIEIGKCRIEIEKV